MTSCNTEISTFEDLFRQHYQPLYKLAYNLTGNHHYAEDIVQEAFLKAFSDWKNFRNESSPYTWLYKITLHCAYRHIRKLKKLPVQALSESQNLSEAQVFNSLPLSTDSEDNLLVNEMREKCLKGFMRCLPSQQRIAFTLRVVLELPVKITADIMGTTANNVKVLTFRARKFMKALMENRCSLLKQDNPCQCRLWVAYALEHGFISKDEAYQNKSSDLTGTFFTEVGILHRIRALHQLNRPCKNWDKFYKKIKNLIVNKNLQILS